MNVRTEWDLDPAFLTVNHGSFGATPRSVRAAQRHWQDQMERQPTRFMSRVLPAALRDAAASLGQFVNVPGQNIVFVDNATTGVNAVLRSLELDSSDEILILNHAYGAVRNAIRFVVQRTGARLVEAKVPFPEYTADALLDAVTAAITPRTRLAVVDHVTSGSALVVPVNRIVAACHAASVAVLIDGAHAPGQIDLDLTDIGADWYVGNCHKWLCAPKGCAFLHARPDCQSGLHPLTISHGFEQGFLAEFDWTGTTDPSRFLSVTAALAFHERLGGRALRDRNRKLAAEAALIVAHRLNTEAKTSGLMTGAMAVIRLPVADPSPEHALSIRKRLLQNNTDAPVHALDDALWLRLSAFAYNEIQDYVRLGEIVAETVRADVA